MRQSFHLLIPVLGQAEVRIQELLRISHVGAIMLLHRHLSRDPDRDWSSWSSNWCSNMGCGHLNPQCHPPKLVS